MACSASTIVPLIVAPATALESAHGTPHNILPRQQKALDAYVRSWYVHSCSCHKNRLPLHFAVSGLLMYIVAGELSEDIEIDGDGESNGLDGTPKKAGSVDKGEYRGPYSCTEEAGQSVTFVAGG